MDSIVQKIRRNIHRLRAFVAFELWVRDLKQQRSSKAFLIGQLRVSVIMVKALARQHLKVRAAALTYFSTLAIVPTLAIVLTILQTFESLDSSDAKDTIFQMLFAGNQDATNALSGFVENAQGGATAGLGIVLLIYSVLGLLGTVETAFNGLWGVRKKRSFLQRFTTYWTILTVAPLLLALSLSITASFRSTQLVAQMTQWLPWGAGTWFFDFLSLASVWITFALLFLIMPNTKVRIQPAVVAAIISGSIWAVVASSGSIWA